MFRGKMNFKLASKYKLVKSAESTYHATQVPLASEGCTNYCLSGLGERAILAPCVCASTQWHLPLAMVEGGMSCIKYILFVFNFIFVVSDSLASLKHHPCSMLFLLLTGFWWASGLLWCHHHPGQPVMDWSSRYTQYSCHRKSSVKLPSASLND